MTQKRKNQKNPFETLNDNDVTKSWIKDNYDLNEHRRDITVEDCVIKQESHGETLSVQQTNNLKKIMNDYPNGQLHFEDRFLDGFEVHLLVDRTRPMTDTEVTDELQKSIKQDVRKKNKQAKEWKEEEKSRQKRREMEQRASEVQIDL